MFSRRLKNGYFVLEGLNSFAIVYYFYYFYFFMQKAHGFDNQANLILAALNGATYAASAWWGGKFAQRFGYFIALKVGFLAMIAALSGGLVLHSAVGHILVMLLTVIGMSFTWPTLEALVSEEEPAAGLQHMVGIYNVVWAATAAVANFSGGAMLDKLGFRSLFFVPIAVQLLQLALTFWLESQAESSNITAASLRPPTNGANKAENASAAGSTGFHDGESSAASSLSSTAILERPLSASVSEPHRPQTVTFLRMAWLANPFAYIAINTLIAVVPGVAARLNLSTTVAGFCCSVWCFSRFAAFFVLWQWNGWHYRFRWLLMAYLCLVFTFAAVVLAPNLFVLVAGQLLFGVAVGLLYYSSLFYSMDLGDTKGEHGGIHEAIIGLGNFAGPAVGAGALHFLPQYPSSGIIAVTLLLLSGAGGLMTIWRAGNRTRRAES
jgi:predicted MFS family arabinose efflux permease